MLLSARPLKDCASVNSFEIADVFEFTAGDGPTCYFMLIDAALDNPSQGFSPSGRRYCPPASSTLSVVVENINDGKKVTRSATQPFATTDASIWAVTLLSTDTITGTANLRLALVEPSGQTTKTTRGLAKNVFRIHTQETC